MVFAIGRRQALGILLSGTVLVSTGGGGALAQIGNQPYQPGGIGLSSAARQAIYNSRVFDSRPRNLLRGRDGTLLDVARDNNQAFARVPGTGTLAHAARGGAGWATGLGTGLGWGGFGAGGGLAHGYGRGGGMSESMMQWISMLNFVGTGVRVQGLPPVVGGGTPLDIWIDQSDAQ